MRRLNKIISAAVAVMLLGNSLSGGVSALGTENAGTGDTSAVFEAAGAGWSGDTETAAAEEPEAEGAYPEGVPSADDEELTDITGPEEAGAVPVAEQEDDAAIQDEEAGSGEEVPGEDGAYDEETAAEEQSGSDDSGAAEEPEDTDGGAAGEAVEEPVPEDEAAAEGRVYFVIGGAGYTVSLGDGTARVTAERREEKTTVTDALGDTAVFYDGKVTITDGAEKEVYTGEDDSLMLCGDGRLAVRDGGTIFMAEDGGLAGADESLSFIPVIYTEEELTLALSGEEGTWVPFSVSATEGSVPGGWTVPSDAELKETGSGYEGSVMYYGTEMEDGNTCRFSFGRDEEEARADEGAGSAGTDAEEPATDKTGQEKAGTDAENEEGITAETEDEVVTKKRSNVFIAGKECSITYNAKGLFFENGSTTNIVKYRLPDRNVYISKTDNVSDDGSMTGEYGKDLSTVDVITVPNAEKLYVTVTYQTESSSFDYVAIYDGSVSPDSSNIENSVSGRLGGTAKKTATYEISGNTVQFFFKSDGGSNNYYGYYAEVSTEGFLEGTIVDGEYMVPVCDELTTFVSWNMDFSGSGVDVDPDKYTPTEDITLYAKYNVQEPDWLSGGTGGKKDISEQIDVTFGEENTLLYREYGLGNWATASFDVTCSETSDSQYALCLDPLKNSVDIEGKPADHVYKYSTPMLVKAMYYGVGPGNSVLKEIITKVTGSATNLDETCNIVTHVSLSQVYAKLHKADPNMGSLKSYYGDGFIATSDLLKELVNRYGNRIVELPVPNNYYVYVAALDDTKKQDFAFGAFSILPEPEPFDIVISKTDINGHEIAGAQMKVTGREEGASADITPITWTSEDGKNRTISVKPGTYTLHEEAAPESGIYVKASDITFTVDTEGKVKVAGRDVDRVTMVDEYAPHDVVISKTDINGHEIAGAQLKITGRETGKTADITPITWTSEEGKDKTVKLRAGTYTLHEEAAPEGYLVASDIGFTVENDGSVTVNGNKADKIIMTDVRPCNLEIIKQHGVSDFRWNDSKYPFSIDVYMDVTGSFLNTNNKEITLNAGFGMSDIELLSGGYIFNGQSYTNNKWSYDAAGTKLKYNGNINPAYIYHAKIRVNNVRVGGSLRVSLPQGSHFGVTEKDLYNLYFDTPTYYINDTNVPGSQINGTENTITENTVCRIENNLKKACSFEFEKAVIGESDDDRFFMVVGSSKYADFFYTPFYCVDYDGGKYYATYAYPDSINDYYHALVPLKSGEKSILYMPCNAAYTIRGELAVKPEYREWTNAQIEGAFMRGDLSWADVVSGDSYKFSGALTEFTDDYYSSVTLNHPSGNILSDIYEPVINMQTYIPVYKRNNEGSAISGASMQVIRKADNTILASWTSNADKPYRLTLGSLGITNNTIRGITCTGDEEGLLDDIYILREVSPPSGYSKADDIEFRIGIRGVDGSEYGVTEAMRAGHRAYTAGKQFKDFFVSVNGESEEALSMIDLPAKHNVVISKTDISGHEIAGAQMKVTGREDGASADITPITWTSEDGKDKTVSLRPGTYNLHEEAVPDSNVYVQASDIGFVVTADGKVKVNGAEVSKITMVDEYTFHDVEMSKADVNGHEIAGAQLKVTGRETSASADINPITWVSEEGKNKTVSLRPGTYTMTETAVPESGVYVKAADINFVVDINGNVKVSNRIVDKIAMVDKYAFHDVVISKTDINGHEIAGAQMKVTGREEGASADITPITWTSEDSKDKTISVRPGTYTLHEEAAPESGLYVKASDITFTVDKNGKVKVSDKDVEKITMIDEYNIASLRVKKTVTGNMGDRHRDYNFTITLKDAKNAAYTKAVSYKKGTETGTLTPDASGKVSFTLSHRETIEFTDLLIGTKYEVTEADYRADGYTTTSSNASGTVAKTNPDAEFVNSKGTAVPTGVRNVFPWFTGLVILAGAAYIAVIRRRKA